MEIKTLKNLEPIEERFVFRNELKAEAIKWVKSDLKDWNSISKDVLLKRWMKRLDITSEDLK